MMYVVWRLYLQIEAWPTTREQFSFLFQSHVLIGRSSTILERFIITRVWRQYGHVQDALEDYAAYARIVCEIGLGWTT